MGKFKCEDENFETLKKINREKREVGLSGNGHVAPINYYFPQPQPLSRPVKHGASPFTAHPFSLLSCLFNVEIFSHP